MTELYMGLAAMEAGLVAVFVASTFVLAQMARSSFSVASSGFVFGKKEVRLFLSLGGLVVAVGLAGAIRTAYASEDALPGNWYSDVIFESIWPAVGLGVALFVTAGLGGRILTGLVDSLQGPGLIEAMADSVDTASLVDWVGGTNAADPLEPFFEAAHLAVKEGRLSLPALILAEIHSLLSELAYSPEAAAQKISGNDIVYASLRKYNDFVTLASASSLETQVDVGLSHMARLGTDPALTQDGGAAVRLAYELSIWASRFVQEGQDTNAVSAIRYARDIARDASERDHLESFADISLSLGKVTEVIAANLQDETERLIPTGFTEPRYDDPLSALGEAMDEVTTLFTKYEQEVRGEIHQGRLVLDALEVCCSSFLNSKPYGKKADDAAARFMRDMGHLGVTGAKCNREDVAGMVIYGIEQLYRLPNVTSIGAKEFMTSACIACYEIGIYVEANRLLSRSVAPNAETDLRDRLVRVCRSSGSAALSEAKNISLFHSGLPINIQDQAEINFRAFVEGKSG